MKKYLPYQVMEFGWFIGEGENDSHIFQARCKCFPQDFLRADFPVRLNIFWEMAEPLYGGLASPKDIALMQKFEDRILRGTEMNGVAILVAVVTGKGEREFIFQVNSKNLFLQALTEMPQEVERYPIEIYSADDAEWGYFNDLTDSLVLGS